MKKKDTHIGKFFRDQLPEPEVPADDAWAGMNNILNAAAGAGGAASGQAGKWFSALTKLKSVLLITSTVVSVSAVIIYQTLNADTESNSNQKKILNTKPEIAVNAPSKAESGNTNESIENKKDSASLPGNEALSFKSDSISSHVSDSVKLTLKAESKLSGAIEKNVDKVAGNNAGKSVSHEKLINSNSEKSERTVPRTANNSRRVNGSRRRNNITLSQSENTISGNVAGRFHESSPNHRDEKVVSKKGSFTALPSEKSDSTLPAEKQFNVQNLKSRKVHFATYDPHLNQKIIVKKSPKQPKKEQSKSIHSLHIGLDWSLNSSLKSTQYLLTGADSIQHIGRFVIPGIFVTQNWNKNSATFSFSPYQSYFGGNKLIQQLPDSANTDSSKSFHNTRFIKSTGLNFSLQYQYHVTRLLALNAGVSYSIFTAALFRPQFQNWQNKFLDERLKTLKSSEMSQYINPHAFAIKAGLAFTPGRFQLGFNVILPLNNISKSPDLPLRTLNGQAYLRFLIW